MKLARLFSNPLRWLPALLAIISLLTGPSSSVAAGPPHPQVPSEQSLPPAPASGETSVAALSSHAASLPALKAVIIVGPIDGDYGSATMRGKVVMDLAATELAANGVTVRKFYTPANDWVQIRAAADGAHFLFYRGHGVYWSDFPYPTVGGFYLKDRFVSPNDIRNDLNLAPNAIVVMSGACFASGSSSVGGDLIGSEEARRRVAQYSDPFFDVGAAGYYSNWYGAAPQMFVRYLFQGMTLGGAYESFFDFNASTVERYIHPDHSQLALWLDKDYYGGETHYNNAFAGRPNRTLEMLFGGAGTPMPAIQFLPIVMKSSH